MYKSKLYWTIFYFSFYSYWIVSISAFAFSLGIPIGITSSVIGLKIYAIMKCDKIALLAKSKLNSIEVLICKALTDSNISHDKIMR